MATSDLIRKLAHQEKGFEDSCRHEWENYEKAHPDTKQKPGEFVQKCVKKKEKARKDKLPEDDTSEKSDNVKKLMDKGVSKKDAEAMTNAGVSSNTDPKELEDGLDDIGKKKKGDWVGKAYSLADKITNVVEFLSDIVNFDEFVLGLPERVRGLAKNLRDYNDKQKSEEKGEEPEPEEPEPEKSALEKPKNKKPETTYDQRNVPNRTDETRKLIKDKLLTEKEVDAIQDMDLNRTMSDAEFMRIFLKDADAVTRRKVKDMSPEEFRKFYTALWDEKQA